jgi:hypothetical protein
MMPRDDVELDSLPRSRSISMSMVLVLSPSTVLKGDRSERCPTRPRPGCSSHNQTWSVISAGAFANEGGEPFNS